MLRARKLWIITVVFCLLLGYTVSLSDGQARRELRVGLPALPTVLDPSTAADGPLLQISRQVFDTLVQYREDGSEIEPGLATSWGVSRDGVVWTFRLRQGVKFHDGTLLTAQTVVKSFERQMSPDDPSAPKQVVFWPRVFRGLPGVIKAVQAPDPQTIQFHLLQPYAPLLTLLAHPALAIVLPGAYEGVVQRFYGTGPYKISEVGAGRVVLESHGGYWGAPARLDRILFLQAEDPVAKAELDAQRLDVVFPINPPTSPQWAVSQPGWTMWFVAVQTEREPYRQKKVRKALAQAVNPALLAAALGNAAIPSQGFLPLGVWGRWEGSPVLGGDPAGARKLLAEAGFPRGISGTLLIEASPSLPDRAMVGEALRLSAASAGIAITVRSEPPEVYQELAQRGDYDLILREMRAEGGDPHLFLYPLSASEGAVRGGGALNFSFFRSSKLDDLLIRASQLGFRQERLTLYRRAQIMLADELPWIPVSLALHWAWVRPEVRGFKLHSSGIHRLDKVWIEGVSRIP
jgi:peptide/nickel transport system substrate-binding protein